MVEFSIGLRCVAMMYQLPSIPDMEYANKDTSTEYERAGDAYADWLDDARPDEASREIIEDFVTETYLMAFEQGAKWAARMMKEIKAP